MISNRHFLSLFNKYQIPRRLKPVGGLVFVVLLVFLTGMSTPAALFCKDSLAEMGEQAVQAAPPPPPTHLQLKVLFGTIIDTADIVKDLKNLQYRALTITRDTREIQKRVMNTINETGKNKSEIVFYKQKYFTEKEAGEFAMMLTRLKDLKLSITHLQRAVPLTIDNVVEKILSYHKKIDAALVSQMERTLQDLVENDPDSSRILKLNALITNQALNTQNDIAFGRLKEIIDGLKIVDAAVKEQLVPIVLPFIDETKALLEHWLFAYNDPIFNIFFIDHRADLVMEAYELVQSGKLNYSHDSILRYLDANERVR